jgi:hypothetical protein
VACVLADDDNTLAIASFGGPNTDNPNYKYTCPEVYDAARKPTTTSARINFVDKKETSSELFIQYDYDMNSLNTQIL